MTRQLLLLRHGKSDWDAPYEHDHERPVGERGVRDAERIGRFLAAAGEAPDLVICSTAVRARRTVELAAGAGRWSCPVRATRDLYGADFAALLRVLHEVDDAVETLLLAGHEPLWSTAASRLIGGGTIRFPTAAVASIRFAERRWSEIGEGSGQLAWLLPPRLLSSR